MKNYITICLITLLNLLFSSVANCEDLQLAHNLKRHFEDKSQFKTWYKSLNSNDKNQFLAGTVTFCQPELTEIALTNGGDIKTPVYHIFSAASYGMTDTYLDVIFISGSKEQADKTALAYNRNISEKHTYDSKHKNLSGEMILSDSFISLLSQGIAGCASPEDKIEMTKILLKNGADINTTNKYGENAFQFAVEAIRFYTKFGEVFSDQVSQISESEAIKQLFKLLIENIPPEGVSPEVQTGAVLYALSYGDEEITDMVKKAGFKINFNTAIIQYAMPDIICAQNEVNNKLLQDLLNSGVKPKDEFIFSAIQCRNPQAAEALLNRGVTASSSALSLAVHYGEEDIVKQLLSHGAKTTMSDGRSAFESCASNLLSSMESICSLNEEGYKLYKKGLEDMKRGGVKSLL